MLPHSSIVHPLIIYLAGMHDVPLAAFTGPSRRQKYVVPRAVACWMLMARGYGSSEIGRMVGRDHSTVLYAVARVENDPVLLQHARRCQQMLEQLATEGRA